MNIFFTGPSSTPYAREFVSNAAVTLRKLGHRVFVPHEGGWAPPEEPYKEALFDFEKTQTALSDASVFIAILDGYTVDDGVAAQLGAFHLLARQAGTERRMLGVLHDTRVAGRDWSGGDRALTSQIRQSIHEFGSIYPNIKAAIKAVEELGE